MLPTKTQTCFQYPPPDRISCNPPSPKSPARRFRPFSIHHRIELAATDKHPQLIDLRESFQYPPPDRISCNTRPRRSAYLTVHFQYPPPDRISCNQLWEHLLFVNCPTFQYPPPDRISCNTPSAVPVMLDRTNFQYPPPDRISCNFS